MCSLRNRMTEEHVCGGVLIDKNHVATAAHCVDPKYGDSAGAQPLIYCGSIYIAEKDDDNVNSQIDFEKPSISRNSVQPKQLSMNDGIKTSEKVTISPY